MPASRRTWLLVGTAALAFIACGDGGSAGPGPQVTALEGQPAVRGWDPFTSANQQPRTAEQPVSCGPGETVTLSEAFDAIFGPICELAVKCQGFGDDNDDDPPAATPYPSSKKDAGSTEIRQADTQSSGDDMVIPQHCSALIVGALGSVEDDGFAAICGKLNVIVSTLESNPECNPVLKVPQGFCLAAVSRCLEDLAAGGCSVNLESIPDSCQGVNFELDVDDDDELVPVPSAGTGGSPSFRDAGTTNPVPAAGGQMPDNQNQGGFAAD